MTKEQVKSVTKRDGTKVPADIEKWTSQIDKVCEGLDGVSTSMIQLNANMHFYDGISTREIDNVTLRSMVDLINEEDLPGVGNINYQYAAGRQRISMLRKDVYGQYAPPRLYEIVVANVARGVYTPELLTWYSEAEWNELDKVVDHDKDESLPYAAVEQLIEKYLVQDRTANGKVFESPQVRYAVAAATAFHAEKTNRMTWVKDFYKFASDGLFTLATPVLAGLGTNTKQFSSCVLIAVDDTLKSIFASGQVMADYASKRAGIGLDMGRIRGLGAPIRGGEVKHTGHIPFLKKMFYDLRSCSQGGIRNASATVNYPIWHAQFEDLIVLKNNQGTEESRVRHMDYCFAISKFFFRRLKNGEDITLFDPHDVPDLYEAYYSSSDKFAKLYRAYENDPKIPKKSLPAEQVLKAGFATERGDTGRIFAIFPDNVANQGPLDPEIHPVTMTNLCTEVLQYTAPFQTVDDEKGRIALCTLASQNWGAFRNPEDMKRPLIVIHRALHNLLQYQDFLSVQSKLHNIEFEPLGIGLTNLAYWHAKRKLKYGDPEALAEIKVWMEHQAFYLTQASVQLAKEKGPCGVSHLTRYGKGIFPWELRAEGVNELTDFTPSPDLDWEGLRADLLKYGIRNATLMAIAPVESSSVVLNSTNGINMVKELIVVKDSKAGAFVQVVPEYRKLKKHYQLLWDQDDCVGYLKTAAVLQAYIDQGISVDTWYNNAKFPEGVIPSTLIIGNIMRAVHWGIKALYYDLRNKEALKALISAADEAPTEPIPEDLQSEEYCESCVL